MSSGIYEIRNMVNGHRYIGSSCDLKRRKKDHFTHLRANRNHCGHLQNAFNLYGEENLIFTVLYECQPCDLIRCEQEELDILQPEYNIRKIAENNTGIKTRFPSPLKGTTIPEERKRRISQSHIGIARSEETKRKLSLSHTGLKASESAKKNMSISRTGEKNHFYGKKHTEESKKKSSESHIGLSAGEKNPMFGKHHSDEIRKKIGQSRIYPRGYTLPEEQKQNLSIKAKERWHRWKTEYWSDVT